MKRLLCFFCCLCLCAPYAACAQTVIDAEIEPYVDYVDPFTRDMSLGNSGEDVLFLQHRLYGLGYKSSVGDGYFDEETEEAIKNFQQSHTDLGLSRTGTADKATLNALMSDAALPAVLQKGDEGEDVKRLQNALIEYGFLDDAADGRFGKNTEAAVTALQAHIADQGMTGYGTDGKASALMQELLYSGAYNPYMRDLKYLDEGADVLSLSGRLNALGYMDIDADSFNDYMRDAIKDFQRDNGIDDTGVADRATFAALYSSETKRAGRYTRRVLAMDDEGDTVTELQWALMVNGFMGGYTTGKFDKKTSEALERLKEYWLGYGDEQTESVSPDLQNRILDGGIPDYTIDVKSGDKSDAVRRVQRRLNTLFYLDSSNLDGIAGKKLESAIKLFQQKNGLAETGIADEATQKAMFSTDAVSDGSKFILRVSTDDQRVYVYARRDDGGYDLIKTMLCSTGTDGTPTPNGIYKNYTRPQDRWHYFTQYYCWAQYSYIISGNILFHSVLYNSRSENAANYTSVAKLGKKASHGCVRLAVEDAKWIFDNCEAKTVVIVHPK